MQPHSRNTSGWRGVCLVAITYVYFLIFAQFAFLKRLAELGIEDTHLKLVMAAMAIGGILLSLATPRLQLAPSPSLRMQAAFLICGGTALFSTLHLGLIASVGVAWLIGAGLGLLTVTLVTHLRTWLGAGQPLLKAGLGTGLGYLACNLPQLFAATPRQQAYTAAALCLAGLLLALGLDTVETQQTQELATTPSFPRVLACFTALIWLDSAAFYIIQSTPALKAGTWQGTLHLWTNGGLHLVAAIASAWLLRRRGLSFVLASALLALACACLLLLSPDRLLLASVFYPVGVSLYSVALVAYPSLLAPATSVAERGRQAGTIYAVAGWVGSAMGIGMGQHLGHVPPAFVAVAAAIVLAPALVPFARDRWRELAATAAVLLMALGINQAISHPAPSTATQIEHGRKVYIAEGCIHCHSQYVRPGSADVALWGPVQSLDELRAQRPPLIGNRRQGPDLSQVGTRRSALWLKMHFYAPAELNPTSFMPSYRQLFEGSDRGDDLVAYLESLHSAGTPDHLRMEANWHSSASTTPQSDEGPQLFARYCATCHTPGGTTRTAWQHDLHRLPPNLLRGPWTHLPQSADARLTRLQQIVKFGIPGTDMPGHEYLPDREIASLSLWLQQSSDLTHPIPGATP